MRDDITTNPFEHSRPCKLVILAYDFELKRFYDIGVSFSEDRLRDAIDSMHDYAFEEDASGKLYHFKVVEKDYHTGEIGDCLDEVKHLVNIPNYFEIIGGPIKAAMDIATRGRL